MAGPIPEARAKISQAVAAARAGDRAAAIAATGSVIRDHPAFARDNAVALANLLLCCAEWPLVESLLPPQSSFFHSSGWLSSLAEGRPVNAQGQPIPWFTYPAIRFVEQRLRPTFEVFEWGCGASTLWWAARVTRIVAVEHSQTWYDQVRRNAPRNVDLRLIADPSDYVRAIETAENRTYDVIVIDGEERNACAAAAGSRLKDGGFIIFDNADGRRHRDGLTTLQAQGFHRLDFFGLIPSYPYENCTSVFFRGSPPETYKFPDEPSGTLGPTCWQAMGH